MKANVIIFRFLHFIFHQYERDYSFVIARTYLGITNREHFHDC
jgi:hypothetical protein